MIVLGGVKSQSRRVDVVLADDGVQSRYDWLSRREAGIICPGYKCGEWFIADIEDHENTHTSE